MKYYFFVLFCVFNKMLLYSILLFCFIFCILSNQVICNITWSYSIYYKIAHSTIQLIYTLLRDEIRLWCFGIEGDTNV